MSGLASLCARNEEDNTPVSDRNYWFEKVGDLTPGFCAFQVKRYLCHSVRMFDECSRSM